MRNGASDTFSHAEELSIGEVLHLYQQQIQEELYPLRGEEGIEEEIKKNEAALDIAKELYAEFGEEAAELMTHHPRRYVQAIGKAITEKRYRDIAF